MNNHYFSNQPVATASQRHLLNTRLAGQQLQLEAAEGVFSHQGLDKATAILLEQAPPPPGEGNLLDLGCGWGPIALTLALCAPKSQIWAVDVSARAVDLTRRNHLSLSKQLPVGTPIAPLVAGQPEEILQSLEKVDGLDLIWSNPPVRVGKQVLHEMLQTWLPRLKPTGQAILVMSKNLGADSLTKWLTENDYQVDRIASKQGFRLLKVTRNG